MIERPTQPQSNLPLPHLIEALLFVADGPISLRKLQQVLEAPVEQVELALTELAEQSRSRGLRVQRSGDSLQFVTAPEAASVVEQYLGDEASLKLSLPALETLAIIAYEQPVTRSRIESIRGVNCDRVMASLLARSLICEMGRLETVGRPILYGTSFEFLQYFGLSDLRELPPLAAECQAAGIVQPELESPVRQDAMCRVPEVLRA